MTAESNETALQNTIFRDGGLEELRTILTGGDYRRILFIVDEDAYEASGASAVVEPIFADRDVARLVDFKVNTSFADVVRGSEMAKTIQPDVVIALGGGSAIDLGKLSAVLSVQSDSLQAVIAGSSPIRNKGLPLIAIPTTAGTGSEATHFAVAYMDGQKYSVAHPYLRPVTSIVDPQLTCSMPRHIAASTGLDALCQSIESMWAVGATDESVRNASEACRWAVDHLVAAVQNPTTMDRMAMCRASHLAGRAIDVSKTTASHALSYALTTRFSVPHGLAVALTIGPMLLYNADVTESDCQDNRGASHVRARIDRILRRLSAQTPQEGAERLRQIITEVGGFNSLADVGVSSIEQLHWLVDSVNVQRLENNPRRADRDTLVELLRPSVFRTPNDGSPPITSPTT